MSDNWYSFDTPTLAEREAEQIRLEIEALEKQALDACYKIKAAGEKRPKQAGQASRASLIHISTMAAYHGKKLGER